MWLNEEARIAYIVVANINQVPGTDGFTSLPKNVVMNRGTSSFLRVELSILIGKKSLYLSGT